MFQTLRKAWAIPELRKKLLYTLFIIVIFRLGSAITVPFLDNQLVSTWMSSAATGGNFLEYLNILTGGALSQATIFSLSITPYINASIIVQLLTYALPPLERLQSEGEEGRKTLNKITAFVSFGLSIFMSFAYYLTLKNKMSAIKYVDGGYGIFAAIVIIGSFVAGSMLVMWLGNRISENGIGNGTSMILFAGIIARMPKDVGTAIQLMFTNSQKYVFVVPLVGLLFVAMITFIVLMNEAERRIPIQYAKRVVGRKVYGGQNTNLPIKVSMSGVMPIIFAQSICSLPATICAFTGKTSGWWYENVWSSTCWFYAVMYFLMIFFFSWFYSTIQYDPVEISNNLKKNGGFIPGFRPGRPTADFIQKVINKIVVFGAVYLGVVALLPIIAGDLMVGVRNLAIGGTSVIIVVGVALETVKALEAQLLMRHYKGFLD